MQLHQVGARNRCPRCNWQPESASMKLQIGCIVAKRKTAVMRASSNNRPSSEQQQQPRHPQSSTAAHAYVSSFVQHQQPPTQPPAPRPSDPIRGLAARLAHSEDHHHTAYKFKAPNWDPLVGRSRQHARVEKEITKAAASTKPLLISGDAGLDTLRLAATAHALGLGEEDASHPMVVIDCNTAAGAVAAAQLLLGGPEGLPPSVLCSQASLDVANDVLLLSALSRGTLVLDNMHKAPRELLLLADAAITTLLSQQASRGLSQAGAPPQHNPSLGSNSNHTAAAGAEHEQPGSFLQAHNTRLVMIMQPTLAQLLQQLDQPGLPAVPASVSDPNQAAAYAGLRECPSIALPALRARSSDIGPLAVEAGQGLAALRGYHSIDLSEAATKQLTSYSFPGNEAELRGLVQRAIMLHPPAPTAAARAAARASCASLDSPGCSCDGPGGSSHSCSSSDGGSLDGQMRGKGSCGSEPVLTLDAQDFWAATGDADRARLDVLELMPWMRRFILNTGLWPVGLNRITSFLYPLVLLSLFLGPQDRESSAALTVFWAGWWPLVLLSFPFLGRAWCAMCPFMITGEAAQVLVDAEAKGNTSDAPAAVLSASTMVGPAGAAASASTAAGGATESAGVLGVAAATASMGSQRMHKVSSAAAEGLQKAGWQLQKWPTAAIEPWAGVFVISAFAGILIWEHVWDLPGHAVLSGWLLMLITAGAVGCSIIYEKRLWCRFLCPIGAMNGLFAKLSMTEIRSRSGLCAAAACSKPCHNGRVEHQMLEVPSTSGAAGAAAVSPSFAVFSALAGLSRFLPWAKSEDACQAGTCSECLPDSSSSSNGNYMLPGEFSCSAFVDAGSSGAMPVGASGDAGAAGTLLQQVDVLLPGCPMNSYPGKNLSNQQCIMCGNCLRSCTSGSAQWRLRPPAADLWGDHEASWAEVHLMNVLLGSVLLHSLPEVCAQLGLPSEALMSDRLPHVLLSAAVLAAPSAVTWLFHKASTAAMHHLTAKAATALNSPAAVLTATPGRAAAPAEHPDDAAAGGEQLQQDLFWLKLSYSVLPLVWAGLLAHYETPLLTELGLTAPRLALSLGVTPDTAWLSALPTLGPAPAAVVAAAQGVTLFLGTTLSWALAGKIGSVEASHGRVSEEQVKEAVLPQRIFTLLMAAELWHVIL